MLCERSRKTTSSLNPELNSIVEHSNACILSFLGLGSAGSSPTITTGMMYFNKNTVCVCVVMSSGRIVKKKIRGDGVVTNLFISRNETHSVACYALLYKLGV